MKKGLILGYDLNKKLVIAISSRALFNLEDENKIFEETNTRDALAEHDMRKAEVESLMDLKKAQMGLINLNY